MNYYIFLLMFVILSVYSSLLAKKGEHRDVQAMEQKERTAAFMQEQKIEEIVNNVMRQSRPKNRPSKNAWLHWCHKLLKKKWKPWY